MINVTNIERFALHDGPGIRTTLFLKGCPLYCPWCANPETQSNEPTLFHDQNRCVKCRTCEQVCASEAITFTSENEWLFNQSKCTYCNECVENCFQDALHFMGKQMEVSEILDEAMKDVLYYEESGGGISVSGGEPMVQKEQLIELLKQSKQLGLHTAIETALSYSLSSLQDVEPYVDMFLCDFKHIDNRKLKEVCGGDNILVKKNLTYLLQKHSEHTEVRIPVIPNFNYEKEVLQSMLVYLHELGAKQVALLPYHTLGKNKYDKMKQKYTQDGKMLDKKDLEHFKQFGESLGLHMKIGG